MTRHVWLAALLLLGACGSSPQPHYYTLSAMEGVSVPGKAVTVKVRHPGIPTTIDRPEMVTQSDDFRLNQNETHLWSEPLGTMVERTLAQDLGMRLTGATVVTETSDIPLKKYVTVDVDLQQFGTNGEHHAVLVGQLLVRSVAGKAGTMAISLEGGPVTSPETLARNLSVLLGQLADTVAHKIQG